MRAQTRASAVRRTAGRVSLAALVLALAPLPAFAAPAAALRGIVPPRNPSANIAPQPNYDDCHRGGLCTEGPPCYTSTSRRRLHRRAASRRSSRRSTTRAPRKAWARCTCRAISTRSAAASSLLVVIDLERVGRGLPAFAGIVASLDKVAQNGVQVSGQPAGTFADPAFPAGFRVGPGACSPTSATRPACNMSAAPDPAPRGFDRRREQHQRARRRLQLDVQRRLWRPELRLQDAQDSGLLGHRDNILAAIRRRRSSSPDRGARWCRPSRGVKRYP